MDRSEATAILEDALNEIRLLPYTDIVGRYRDEQQVLQVTGASGAEYQIEVEAFWDDPRRPGNLRVMASIDDGGWSAFAPITRDFIIAADGSFMGE
jgi:hypothetical protein